MAHRGPRIGRVIVLVLRRSHWSVAANIHAGELQVMVAWRGERSGMKGISTAGCTEEGHGGRWETTARPRLALRVHPVSEEALGLGDFLIPLRQLLRR